MVFEFDVLSISTLSSRRGITLHFSTSSIAVTADNHLIINAVIDERLYVASLRTLPVSRVAAVEKISSKTTKRETTAKNVVSKKRTSSVPPSASTKRGRSVDAESLHDDEDLFEQSGRDQARRFESEVVENVDIDTTPLAQRAAVTERDSRVQHPVSPSVNASQNTMPLNAEAQNVTNSVRERVPAERSAESEALVAGQSSNVRAASMSDTSPRADTAEPAGVKALPFLWHERFGHVSMHTLATMSKTEAVLGLPKMKDANFICEPCIFAKQAATPHNQPATRATRPLELIHIDIGFFGEPSLDRHESYLVIVDDFSRYAHVSLLIQKSGAFYAITNFVKWAETQLGVKLKRIRCDNAKEFDTRALHDFYEGKGIQIDFSSLYSPQQNGVAERMNRTIKEMTRALMFHAKQKPRLWHLASKASVYTRNRVVGATTDGKTPYELFWNEKPSVAHLRTWGCVVYVKRNKLASALAPRSDKQVFVGYTNTTHNYKVMSLETRKVTVSNNVLFVEDEFVEVDTSQLVRYKVPNSVSVGGIEGETATSAPTTTASSTAAFDGTSQTSNIAMENEDEAKAVGENESSLVQSAESVGASTSPVAAEGGDSVMEHETTALSETTSTTAPAATASTTQASAPQVQQRVWRSSRLNAKHNPAWQAEKPLSVLIQALSIVVTDTEPLTFEQAVNSNDSKHWVTAMNSEIASLNAHNTGTLVERPPGNVNILPNKWVFRIKRDAKGRPVKFKARLVVKGFKQTYGYDYFETFAPTVRISTILVVLAIVAHYDLELHQLDVDTAFLYGKVEEKVYMEQPDGYEDAKYPQHVWRLNKALYGLKQAPLAWYKEINTFFLTVLLFKRVVSEYGLYVYIADGIRCIVCLYVDDILIACNDLQFLKSVKAKIAAKWSIKDIGEAKFVLGLSIDRDRSKRLLRVTQESYIKSVLEKFGMSTCKGASTPAAIQRLVKPDEFDQVNMPNIPYRQATGSLIYACYTRPDMVWAVGQVCKYNNCFSQIHWTALKRILKYAYRTAHFALVFDGTKPLRLTAYSDADFANDENRKSYSGYAIYIGNSCISYGSSQQTVTAVSTMEAEYVAIAYTLREALYLRMLLSELGVPQSMPTEIYCDNKAAVTLCSNPTRHRQSKHIDISFHRIRDEVEGGEVVVLYVESENNPADVFTKPLGPLKHSRAVQLLRMS